MPVSTPSSLSRTESGQAENGWLVAMREVSAFSRQLQLNGQRVLFVDMGSDQILEYVKPLDKQGQPDVTSESIGPDKKIAEPEQIESPHGSH